MEQKKELQTKNKEICRRLMTIKSESQRYSKHLNPVPKNDFEHSLMLKERVKNEGFHILKNIKKD